MTGTLTSPSPPPRPRRALRLRWWLIVLVVLLLLLAGLATTTWWALAREPGTRWLLTMVPGIHAVRTQGALLGDFSAERIDIALPRDGTVRLHGAGWRGLQVSRGDGPSLLHLRIASLTASRVEIVPGAPSSQPDAPATAPQDLRLPVELEVGALEIGRIDLPGLDGRPLRDLRARVHLNADGGTRHRVDGLALAFDRLLAQGRAQIGTRAPLALDAEVSATQDGTIANAQWSAQASLSGPLAEPALRATVRAMPQSGRDGAAPAAQSLDLDATLRPFAAWPLGELNARASGLDVSAFVAGAPATALSGRATAQTAGVDRPMTLEVELQNALPGRWNEARLPLRQLRLSLRGRPDDPETLELLALDAELGDEKRAAGRITGQGRWARDGWSLDATLAGVQPAVLDARAAPMTLAGPVQLRGSPPGAEASTLDARAELTGALSDRGPARPVQLRLDGTWRTDAQGGQRFELREAAARAAGARADAKATVERTANADRWHAVGQATLRDFDPLPWWPGREDSPWRKGPHRLNAQARFDLALPAAAAASAPGARGSPAKPAGIVEQIAKLRGTASATVADSLLAGVPLDGEMQLRSDAGTHATVAMRLRSQGNRVDLDGRVAKGADRGDDRWDLAVDAPALNALVPLWALVRADAPSPALAGHLKADAHVEGRWPGLMTSSGQAQIDGLKVDTLAVRQGQARWQLGSRMDAPVGAEVQASGIRAGAATVDAIDLQLRGTGRAHRLALHADTNLRPPGWTDALLATQAHGGGTAAAPATSASGPARSSATSTSGPGSAVLAAEGGFLEGPDGAPTGWRGTVQQLEMRAGGASWLWLRDVALALGWGAAPLEVTVQPGRAEVLGAALRWQRLFWRAADGERPAQIEANAQLEPLPVAPLLARIQPAFGWGGDLTIVGHIDVRSAPTFVADIVLERARGDLTVTDETGTQALGLTDLRLGLAASDGVWSFTQGLAGSTLGVAAGAVVARTSPTAVWPAPETPIEGVLELRVANLGTWGTWVPAGWRLGGALRTSAVIGGRFGAPEYTGELRGERISVRNFVQGVNVTDGEVAIDLRGATAHIEKFTARAGDGTVRLEGDARLGENPNASLRMVAERFRVLGRVDRRIVASGQAQLALTREALALEGRFDVDEGLFDVSHADAPSLSDDVIVVRRPGATEAQRNAQAAAQTARPPFAPAKTTIDLRLGLGDRLRLRGRGLDTGLRGDLRLTVPNGKLAIDGAVRTVEGTYQAYGQKLVIDRGEIEFNGPVENPRLDIEATRPNLDIRVGVAVTGTVLNPRIRLFSEPEVPDMDKISWLVLGRASDGLGRTDTALLQRAALALISGEGPGASDQIIGAIGLDELSVRQSDGEVRETIVSLGKQLSRRWYVGYERSLSQTAGTWQLIYRVAQRFTLRAQSGEDNSLDAIWTWRWQ